MACSSSTAFVIVLMIMIFGVGAWFIPIRTLSSPMGWQV
jgi:hypothetical protein